MALPRGVARHREVRQRFLQDLLCGRMETGQSPFFSNFVLGGGFGVLILAPLSFVPGDARRSHVEQISRLAVAKPGGAGSLKTARGRVHVNGFQSSLLISCAGKICIFKAHSKGDNKVCCYFVVLCFLLFDYAGQLADSESALALSLSASTFQDDNH